MNPNPIRKQPKVDDGPEFLLTDPEQRRKVQRLLVAMVVALVLLWWIGLPALKRWLDVVDMSTLIHRMDLLCYGLGVMLLATAGYAAWFARSIFRSSQFPPPGTWVMRDTRLLRGSPAHARGWWVVACAVSFVMLGTFAIGVMPGHFEGLLRAGTAPPVIMQPPSAAKAPPVAQPHG